MIATNEPLYDMRRPPILLVQRRCDFTCEICKKPGKGPPNMAVHPGKCRTQKTHNIAQRTIARAKAKKEKARLLAAMVLSQHSPGPSDIANLGGGGYLQGGPDCAQGQA